MAWVAVGTMAGLGVLQNTLSAENQAAQKKQEMLANAAQIQYSPWTHAAVQTQGMNVQDPLGAGLEGGLQGGVAGALMASKFKKLQPTEPAQPQASVPTATSGYVAGQPYIAPY